MIYCDVHTHREDSSDEHFAIQNKLVDEEQTLHFRPMHYYSYGIHPWQISNYSLQLQLLSEIATHPSVLALGEAGLDKNIDTPLSLQIEVFKAQAELAEQIGKPVIIHCVKAWEELLAAKKEIRPKVPWVIHGFRGNKTLAEQLLKKDFRLSFGEKFNAESIVRSWPEHILLETDESKTGIEKIYALAANALNLSIDLLALRLRKNVQEVFSVRLEK